MQGAVDALRAAGRMKPAPLWVKRAICALTAEGTPQYAQLRWAPARNEGMRIWRRRGGFQPIKTYDRAARPGVDVRG